MTDNLDMAQLLPPYAQWQIAARKKAGVSQECLAELTGIDRGHLSKIETGKVLLPSWETRQRIHNALGTSERKLQDLGIVDRGGRRLTVVREAEESSTVRNTSAEMRIQAMALLLEIEDENLPGVVRVLRRATKPRRIPAPQAAQIPAQLTEE